MNQREREAMQAALRALKEVNEKGYATSWHNAFDTEIVLLMDALLAEPDEQAKGQEVVTVAWDRGYRQGVLDERESEANIGVAGFNAKIEPARENPYRCATPPAQPAREWVSLTREERIDLTAQCGSYDSVCLIESKLREKNAGQPAGCHPHDGPYCDMCGKPVGMKVLPCDCEKQPAADAKAGDEPVAIVGGERKGWFYLEGRPNVKIGDKLYTRPQPQADALRVPTTRRCPKPLGHSCNQPECGCPR